MTDSGFNGALSMDLVKKLQDTDSYKKLGIRFRNQEAKSTRSGFRTRRGRNLHTSTFLVPVPGLVQLYTEILVHMWTCAFHVFTFRYRPYRLLKR